MERGAPLGGTNMAAKITYYTKNQMTKHFIRYKFY